MTLERQLRFYWKTSLSWNVSSRIGTQTACLLISMLMYGTSFNGEKQKVKSGSLLPETDDFTLFREPLCVSSGSSLHQNTKTFWRKSLTLISKIIDFVLKITAYLTEFTHPTTTHQTPTVSTTNNAKMTVNNPFL